MQRLYDKLQTFSDHFFVRPTFFAGYSRQEVNIKRTITVNNAVCSIFIRYSHKDSFSVRDVRHVFTFFTIILQLLWRLNRTYIKLDEIYRNHNYCVIFTYFTQKTQEGHAMSFQSFFSKWLLQFPYTGRASTCDVSMGY